MFSQNLFKFSCITMSLASGSSLQLFLIPIGRGLPRKFFCDTSCYLTKKNGNIPWRKTVIKCCLPRSFPLSPVHCVARCPNNLGHLSHWRTIHTSNKRSALPPAVLILLRPIAKLAAIIFGRTLRKWWQSLPPERKQKIIQQVQRNKVAVLAVIAVFVGGVSHYYLSHLEQDPITKRWRFIAFSTEQMIQIAEMELESQVEEFRGMILRPNHPEYTRVVRVANRILQSNRDLAGITSKDWAVTVVNHPTLKNAFVLPNGNIFIFTGMLEVCDNDDQLGVILAHEMSHAILSHMAEQLSNVQLIEWLLLIPLIVIWALLPDGAALVSQWLSGRFASLMFHLPFSRAIENEADRVGLELAAKACFDVREASVFWAKMAILTQDEESFEWLSTHPSHESRENRLNSMMPMAEKRRKECKCPELPRIDPRILVATLRKDLKENRKVLVEGKPHK